ncbi:MATE family efflux transporter [Oribacterium sp. oral taxon 102]|uniref:MATE family efflux transporter n=1 Tax=Oribacterium sp. oral taxon 102 TaxID=671214 RepID=UPI0015B988C2|nr:MATE family efflux transporter [Oribacterium sp. oral taxon 102]NWO21858.1 MATE family efflux transporter [Oribacterium sp. oral taxon 102]
MGNEARLQDMTTGDPRRLILGFAIPMLLGTLFQQFYSMVDTIIVGRMLGLDALAGVGSTGAVNFMVNGFVIGLCSGFAIPVAQRFGARDEAGLRRYNANILFLGILLSAVMTVLIGILTGPILRVMNTPENIFIYAYRYILIIFLGIPVTFLYNMTASIIRSLGDSRTPVYFLVLASLLNIVLDLVSIGLLGFGVDGPAYATVLSQALSGVLCLLYMKRRFPILKFRRGECRLDSGRCRVLLSMGVPMGLQYSITAIGSVVLQTAVNGLGSAAVAAITAGSRIGNLCCCVFDALGATMATYAGQNVGALRFRRVREGVLDATFLGSVYAVLICVLLALFGGELPKIFVNSAETEVIRNAHLYLLVNSLFYILLVVVNVWRFSIQGMGYSAFAVLAGVCEMAARALVGFVFIPVFGFTAACFASPLAWLFADAFLIPAFFYCLRRSGRMYGGRE